jgi:hypothetical protein
VLPRKRASNTSFVSRASSTLILIACLAKCITIERLTAFATGPTCRSTRLDPSASSLDATEIPVTSTESTSLVLLLVPLPALFPTPFGTHPRSTFASGSTLHIWWPLSSFWFTTFWQLTCPKFRTKRTIWRSPRTTRFSTPPPTSCAIRVSLPLQELEREPANRAKTSMSARSGSTCRKCTADLWMCKSSFELERMAR